MKISVKSRYGLCSMICMAQNYNSGECITIISLAKKLQISKIYLEQVFSLLKRSELVISTKGAQGGYQLARSPKEITTFDILYSIETTLFEKTENTVSQSEKFIEETMHRIVFDILDSTVSDLLSSISLDDLATETEKQSSSEDYMYFL